MKPSKDVKAVCACGHEVGSEEFKKAHPDSPAMGWEEKKSAFVRDVCSVVPKSKSEVRQRLDELLSSKIAEARADEAEKCNEHLAAQLDEILDWAQNHKLFRDGEVGEWEAGHRDAEEKFRSDLITTLEAKRNK